MILSVSLFFFFNAFLIFLNSALGSRIFSPGLVIYFFIIIIYFYFLLFQLLKDISLKAVCEEHAYRVCSHETYI